MLSMLIDDGMIRSSDGSWQAGKLDDSICRSHHDPGAAGGAAGSAAACERAVLEPAAVIGVEFPTPAVTDIAPEAVGPGSGRYLDR